MKPETEAQDLGAAEGYVRLWQSVVIQALLDGSMANPSDAHRIEARAYVRSPIFRSVCEHVSLNPQMLRAKLDDPELFRRLKDYTGGAPLRGIQ